MKKISQNKKKMSSAAILNGAFRVTYFSGLEINSSETDFILRAITLVILHHKPIFAQDKLPTL